MKPQRWLVLAALACSLLSACGTAPNGSGNADRQTHVLTIAVGVDPDTMDPMRQTTTTVTNIVQMVVESLATVDQSGKVQPNLAASWQEASDSMSWVFTLRPGVTFSDGTAFDAAAAKANRDRALDPTNVDPNGATLIKAVKSVDVVDPSHIRLTMNTPLASDVLLGLLSEANFGMVSPRTIQKGTAAYKQQEHPVGTGPYVLKERVKGDHVALARNDTYWGNRPTYDEQVFRVVPDAATREALVRSGQAQVVLLPPISDLPSLQKDSTVKVLMASGDRSVYFAMDTLDKEQPLLQNVQVRQALNYAINRDAIVKSTLFGAADVATSPMASSIFGYCQVPNPYSYNPDLARSMLQRANATNLTITLVSPTGRYLQDWQAAQNVANDLKAVGVNVEGPTTMDWPSYIGTVDVVPTKATVDAHLLGWAPQYLDAAQALQVLDPANIPPRGLATSYYDNPTVAASLQRALVEPNRDARAQEYCDIEKQIWNDAPWIFLWIQRFPIVYSSQVTGIGSVPNESFYTVYAKPA